MGKTVIAWAGITLAIAGIVFGAGKMASCIQDNAIAIQANTVAIQKNQQRITEIRVGEASMATNLENLTEDIHEMKADIKKLLEK